MSFHLTLRRADVTELLEICLLKSLELLWASRVLFYFDFSFCLY